MEDKSLQDQVLELLEQKKFNILRELLDGLNPADLALLLSEFEEKELLLLYRLLPKELATDTFSYMDSDMQMNLINGFSDKELREVLEQTFIDDTVDMIEEMPANVVNRILKNSDLESRTAINQILKYPKDSAGSIMTIEYVNLEKGLSVRAAIHKIRQIGMNKETVYTCYITEARRLIGTVTIRDLLMASDDELVDDIMETNLIYVDTHEDKEEVARQFRKYDFLALPVVDKEQRLVGIVTFDDAMDVIQEENTEDFSKMAAMTPNEDSYFKTSVFTHAKNRIGWLLILMLSAIITGSIITKYEDAFAAIPLLVSFIPMLMDTGGNCGSQSSTLIIRGLALDEIHTKDILRVVFKEFRISLIVSIALAFVNGCRIFFVYKDLKLSFVVAFSLIGTIVIAKIIGCILPIAAKKVHLDPAIMAAPLITTIVDTCSILIYFNIAMRFFNLS